MEVKHIQCVKCGSYLCTGKCVKHGTITIDEDNFEFWGHGMRDVSMEQFLDYINNESAGELFEANKEKTVTLTSELGIVTKYKVTMEYVPAFYIEEK